MSEKSMVLMSAENLVDSDLILRTPPEEMLESDVIAVWSFLDLVEKEMVKKRKVKLRDHLMKLAEEKGTVNKNGSFVWKSKDSDAKVTKQRREAKPSLDADKFVERFEDIPGVCGKALRRQVFLTERDYRLLIDLFNTLISEDPEDVFVSSLLEKVKDASITVDEDVVEGMVKLGMIDLEDLREISTPGKVSWALTVKKPSEIEELKKRM